MSFEFEFKKCKMELYIGGDNGILQNEVFFKFVYNVVFQFVSGDFGVDDLYQYVIVLLGDEGVLNLVNYEIVC